MRCRPCGSSQGSRRPPPAAATQVGEASAGLSCSSIFSSMHLPRPRSRRSAAMDFLNEPGFRIELVDRFFRDHGTNDFVEQTHVDLRVVWRPSSAAKLNAARRRRNDSWAPAMRRAAVGGSRHLPPNHRQFLTIGRRVAGVHYRQGVQLAMALPPGCRGCELTNRYSPACSLTASRNLTGTQCPGRRRRRLGLQWCDGFLLKGARRLQ